MERVTGVLNDAAEKTKHAAEAAVEGTKESGARMNSKMKEIMDVEKEKAALREGTEKLKGYTGGVLNWLKQLVGMKVEKVEKVEVVKKAAVPPGKPAVAKQESVAPKQEVRAVAPQRWYIVAGIAVLVAVGVSGCVLCMKARKKREKQDGNEEPQKPKPSA
ncbi:uncharacterized protein Tco025E_04887 [Trypanosoma conorhini]|uniref:Uncharacterized protein n=1 Tax=Trypanosoma conorhini TaxID=83891 RepID=A0A422PHS3_9TRYP|nr:uncharacterized protein Tco025E_04887 [Trypanosoma conorhini]RNF17246.1 hypothetical protein Tco025E_04887 [Trypanosoma conorhini]